MSSHKNSWSIAFVCNQIHCFAQRNWSENFVILIQVSFQSERSWSLMASLSLSFPPQECYAQLAHAPALVIALITWLTSIKIYQSDDWNHIGLYYMCYLQLVGCCWINYKSTINFIKLHGKISTYCSCHFSWAVKLQSYNKIPRKPLYIRPVYCIHVGQ